MERMIRAGEFYRHFKNKLYQIVAVAVHSESGEPMVVYQALYGDYKIYVRPYDMFVSEVDHGKYPDVKQRYRFERVEPGNIGETDGSSAQDDREDDGRLRPEKPSEPNPHLMRFLDADSYEVQMECLKYLEKTADQADLDSIYVVLDMNPIGGTVEDQVRGIRHYLSMQHHFDGNRLRR